MKKIILPHLLLLLLGQCLLAQVDLDRKQELRLSFLGESVNGPSLDRQLDWINGFGDDLTISYLRKIQKSKNFFKAEIAFKPGFGNAAIHQESSPSDAKLRYANFFLGLERQTNFKHWGLYLGAGVHADYLNFSGDFTLENENLVNGYDYTKLDLGAALQVTAYTNLSDNIYVFLTQSSKLMLSKVEENQKLTAEDVEIGKFTPDFRMIIVDAVGIAYKF